MDAASTEMTSTWWQRILAGLRRRAMGARPRHLRLCEMLPLGERRFVAVIQLDDKQFLIGASATQVQLLAHLDPASASSSASVNDGVSKGADRPVLSVN